MPQPEPAPASRQTCCPIVELRQYTLQPGRRDTLIELFDRAFVETQEAFGMRIIGQFRDVERPDRFVWLRGFSDMPSRAKALADFYGGPVWKTHREAANATMTDSDNVLLLRPATPTSGFVVDRLARQRDNTASACSRTIGVTIHHFDTPVEDQFTAIFEHAVIPVAESLGATILGYFVTERAENTFPQLPVREGEHVFAWIAQFGDTDEYDEFRRSFHSLPNKIRDALQNSIEMLKLSPTTRSAL